MSEYTSYYLYQKYESINGGTPTPVYPPVYSIDGDGTMPKVIRMENDPDCGYVPPPSQPIYRWYQLPISTDYVCDDCGSTPPSPTGGSKLYATYENGTEYTAYCDDNPRLEVEESRPSGYDLSGMTSAIIGDCVSVIYGQVFYNAIKLKTVSIPSTVTNIGVGAFKDCRSLSSVTFGGNSQLEVFADSCFRGCTALTSFTIPNTSSAITIGDEAFYGCGWQNVVIPNNVTNIAYQAFYACRATNVTIGSGVTSIGRRAFAECYSLTALTINRNTPPSLALLNNQATQFDGTNCPIYVPCGSVDTYKSAGGWTKYSSRIEGIPPCGEPQYRTVSGSPYCSGETGYDKYIDIYSQVSYDGGSTWETTATTAVMVELNSEDCGYIPIDYSTQYFTISYSGSVGAGIKWSNTNMSKIKYSEDNGTTWKTFDNYGTIMANGGKLLLKGSGISTSYANGMGHITIGGASSGRFELYGNIMSLVYGDDFADKTSFDGKDYVFKGLLSGNTEIKSATNLIMPATTLSNYCYMQMFQDCTNLTIAPELPAATLTNRCYYLMFNHCTNLNYIKCLATDTSATDCTSLWVQGVSSQTGTFVKPSSMSSWTTGTSGIPSGWTVQDA